MGYQQQLGQHAGIPDRAGADLPWPVQGQEGLDVSGALGKASIPNKPFATTQEALAHLNLKTSFQLPPHSILLHITAA